MSVVFGLVFVVIYWIVCSFFVVKDDEKFSLLIFLFLVECM